MITIHSTSRIHRIPAVLCMVLLAAGCSILPKREPIQVWRPPQVPTAGPVSARTNAANFSVRIDTPTTLGLLDETGIVVIPAPGRISTYKGARWSKPPALLVRRRLVDAFMAAKLPAVTTRADDASTDYTLGGDLRAFQSQYRAGAPVIVVRYDAQLLDGDGQRLLASHSFVVSQKPASAQVPAVVAAFGKADDRIAREVVAWTTEAVNRVGGARGGTRPQ